MQKPTRVFPVASRSLLAVALASASCAWAAPLKQGPEVESRVESILSQMSLSDKISYINIDNGYMMRAMPKFGLPGTLARDSSLGVTVEGTMFGVQYPAQSALAATWNVDLAKTYGLAIGYDTRASGGQQLLSPGLNMYRTPYNGRSAEHLTGEDPFLGAVLAPAVANGIEAQGIWTGAKHFVANEQEANRHYLNVKVDNRTLREIYLPGFESLVKNANPASIMCGFNKINGDYACESHSMIADMLKGEWGFKGFVVSDFNSIQNGYKAAMAGADLDMPSGLQMNESVLMPYVWSGQLPVSVIDEKVRRNLRAMIGFGFDKGLPTASHIGNDPRSLSTSLDMARQGIVLLQNEKAKGSSNNLLPLPKTARIAVIGDIAKQRPPYPFGTGWSAANTYTTELQGLQQLAQDQSQITYIQALSLDPQTSEWYTSSDSTGSTETVAGLTAEYFNNPNFSGEPAVKRVEPGINWDFLKAQNVTANGVTTIDGFSPDQDNFSARFTGKIKPTVNGDQVFKVRGDGAYKLWVDNKLVIDFDGKPLSNDLADSISHSGKAYNLKAGQTYDIKLEYSRVNDHYIPTSGSLYGLQMSWASLAAPKDLSQYDAVMVAVGFNSEYEGEASDHGFDLPEYQSDLIQNVIKANRNTIVVLHGGGGMNLEPWVKKSKAVLHAWYPGQLGGQALAEILFGDTNPSAKLPISIEKRIQDNPAYASYPNPDLYVGDNAQTEMTYSEGVYMGYRGLDKQRTKPLFPFGFGLSYTTFSFSDLKIGPKSLTPGSTIDVTFTVTNTGNKDGYETAQVYVSPQKAMIDRPKKELKGFTKVFLKAGQSKQVTVQLDARSLAYFDVNTWNWLADAGRYMISVGDSSDNLPLEGMLTNLYQQSLPTNTSNPLPPKMQKAVQVDASQAY
ncbi:beta-glucosidase [Pseudomonas luteola]|uniref:Glycoside hydrolase family 3 C-terminal domain-containing protein n=1 Tax=Pseudomonas luteola TaxID=47886 RepID=A0ABS0MY83_PSELU|nr:glycoside hydrolase family 3 C-terminal domain-containing protein [Pseudomonas luteola]MBH3441688.1 glycoside hydrolase family 3 C-terminal domain-containing protein [Pseudomonas luteola]